LLIFNVIVILAGAELLMHNLVSLRTFAVVVLALFVVNLLFVWRAFRKGVFSSDDPHRLRAARKKLWILAVLFTAFGVITIISCIRHGDLDDAFPGLLGLLVPAYLWFLVYRLSRGTKTEKDRPQNVSLADCILPNAQPLPLQRRSITFRLTLEPIPPLSLFP
jgi:uncharacterized membrane protein YsdA (DUF1294 family)